MDRGPHMELRLGRASLSETDDMANIYGEAFSLDTPKLARIMYRELLPSTMIKEILRVQLHGPSEHNKFMVVFDASQLNQNGSPMSYGWISLGIVSHGARMTSLAASDLSAYAFVKLLAKEALNRGEDPSQVSNNNPRFRLARELSSWSRAGQAGHVIDSHLVVNCLALWPETHRDSKWEMAFKLLGWAVDCAEDRAWPIFTQVPVGQMRFFRDVGFRKVESFTLNLNNYARAGSSDMGMQEWVQMVYSPRSARSISSSDRGGWR